MTNLPPVDDADLPDDLRELFAKRREEDYLPNSFPVLAHRPEILRAYIELHRTIYRSGIVSPALKSLVATVRSASAGCRYCQAHTAKHASDSNDFAQEKIDAVWEFETSDHFDDGERAALRLARDAAASPNAVTAEHFEDLRRHFTVPEIVEILAVIAHYGFMNTFNDSLATDLEPAPWEHADQRLAEAGWAVGKHAASS